MIFAASLSRPVKKAMGNKAQQSTVNKIISLLPIDPDTGTMDVVVFGTQDAVGPNKENINRALASKHPDICTIYVCIKDVDKNLLDCDYKLTAKKITPTIIKEIIEDNVGTHKVKTGKMRVSTKDFEDPGTVEFKKQPRKRSILQIRKRDAVNQEDYEEEEAPYEEADLPGDDEEYVNPDEFMRTPKVTAAPLPDDREAERASEVEHIMESVPLDTAKMQLPVIESTATYQNNFVEKASNVADFEIFKELLKKNNIMNQIIHENSDYVSTLNMLDAMENRIEEIYRDPTMDSTAKFEQIRDIGLNRSILKAASNSISTERVIHIITTIADSAKRIVDDKVQSIDNTLSKITTDRANLLNSVIIEKAIDERTETFLELLNLGRSLVDLYQSMDTLVNESINELDAKLPSKNEFINQMVKPVGPNIFTPTNSANLANALLQALTSKRISFGQLEDHLQTTCELISQYFAQSNEIILYQQQQLDLLRANRVEDVIIAPTALKRILKLYVGPDNCGRSATAITWNGVLSRRQNTLLIDLTGKAKFEEYGVNPVSFVRFMNERIEQQYCCVACDHILDSMELQKLLEELPLRLNYFANVGIILSTDDMEGLNFLSSEALAVHYITDCRTAGLSVMREVILQHTISNVARVLVTIDAPISPVSIADSLGLDLTCLKVVPVPNLQQIRACAIRKEKPYELTDVVKIFEGAFNL